jgi:hypothetical protein
LKILPRKRTHPVASERDEEQVAAFQNYINLVGTTADMIMSVDEMGHNSYAQGRNYGRARKGDRVEPRLSFQRVIKHSLVGAFTVDGMIEFNIVEDAVNQQDFTEFIIESVVTVLAHSHICNSHHIDAPYESISPKSICTTSR